MAENVRRLSIFKNGTNKGVLVKLGGNLEDLVAVAQQKLGIEAKEFYTEYGALIENVELIRDDDRVFVSCGEAFITPNSGNTCKSYNGVGSHMPSHVHGDKTGGTDWIKLNVGGKYFITTRNTLVGNAPGSMLERMFSEDTNCAWSSSVDSTGAYLIDRSPFYFEPILNYLRHGELVLDKNLSPIGVLEEAKFFGILNLVDLLETRVKEDQPPSDSSPVTRRELVMRLIGTPTNTELRCQGINFNYINLSKLDLRHINFKYTTMKNTNLSGCNLVECNFERADMSNCVLDGAKLMGVRMLCVNLEGASMKNCYLEDPAGKQAYLEGANLKFVNLEGSCMAGVNLRVATLRKANLQNCDLRGAILAGADMEDADLTGSDLQEANLRGANLNGAYLELIVNPLHMSQTIPQGR